MIGTRLARAGSNRSTTGPAAASAGRAAASVGVAAARRAGRPVRRSGAAGDRPQVVQGGREARPQTPQVGHQRPGLAHERLAPCAACGRRCPAAAAAHAGPPRARRARPPSRPGSRAGADQPRDLCLVRAERLEGLAPVEHDARDRALLAVEQVTETAKLPGQRVEATQRRRQARRGPGAPRPAGERAGHRLDVALGALAERGERLVELDRLPHLRRRQRLAAGQRRAGLGRGRDRGTPRRAASSARPGRSPSSGSARTGPGS